MSLSIDQTITQTASTGNLVFPTWTPVSDDLLLVGVALGDESIVPTASGNGLTFVEIANTISNKSVFLFRALGSSPSSGAITITASSNTDNILGIAIRISGADTSGTNGSGAIDAFESFTPSPGNSNMKDDITTLSDDSLAIAWGGHGGETFTLPSGQTSISINLTQGIKISSFYRSVASPSTVTLGGDGSISSNTRWNLVSVAVKAALVSTPAKNRLTLLGVGI